MNRIHYLNIILASCFVFPIGISELLRKILFIKERTYISTLVLSSVTFLVFSVVLYFYFGFDGKFAISSWTFLFGLSGMLASIYAEFGIYKLFTLGKKVVYFSYSKNSMVLVIVLTVVIAVFEELVYRHYLFSILEKNLGSPLVLTIILSGLFYGFNHLFGGLSLFLMKFVSGIIFSVIYYFSGSDLLAPIVAHILANIFILIMGNVQRNRIDRSAEN